MSKQGIYKITCIVNGKIYIGKSIDIDNRMYEHKTSLKSNRHANKKLQADYNKYGIDNFIFEIERYTDSPLDTYYYESYYAEKYNVFKDGYNTKSLRKSSSIKKIIDNLDHYVNLLNDRIVQHIPTKTHTYFIDINNPLIEEIFGLDEYDMVTLFRIISTYVDLREGLSIHVDGFDEYISFQQVDYEALLEKLNNLDI